jgi:hypothetical protein
MMPKPELNPLRFSNDQERITGGCSCARHTHLEVVKYQKQNIHDGSPAKDSSGGRINTQNMLGVC